MAKCSIDFHVLSTLWMLKVVHLFDAKLTNCAMGNRLRRSQDGTEITEFSLGSFEPYLIPLRKWRDNGIHAMRTALDEGKKIVALTADVTSFFHELSPGFILAPAFFNDLLALELDAEQVKLHRLFIRVLDAWAELTPLKKGLPVGLPASAVVADVPLVELDRVIEKQVVPLYYGRYVDDILLVVENGADFRSTAELWNWLFARSNGNLGWVENQEGAEKKIGFEPACLLSSKSKAHFANAKNKVFMLAGDTGKALVDAIAHQIHARASEWRAMPRLPRSAKHGGTDLLTATLSDGEAADNLRKADALTMRRAAFAIKLRDLEACARDLHPDDWKEHRHAFFRALTQHVFDSVFESITAAFPPRLSKLGKQAWVAHIAVCHEILVPGFEFFDHQFSVQWYQTQHARLFSFYLAHMPFRFVGLPSEMIAKRGISAKKTVIASLKGPDLVRDAVLDGVKQLARWFKLRGLPHGLLFATRPFNLPELFILNKDVYSPQGQAPMRAVVLALRGFNLNEKMQCFAKNGVLHVPESTTSRKHGIDVSSWQTHLESWTAAVTRNRDPDKDRYARLNRLLDGVISHPHESRYLVLPELAPPAHWFIRIARKLQGRGISPITGIEYLHTSKARVLNKVWAALSHDGLGFPSLMIYRQDKQRPALHEEQEIHRLAGLQMKPETSWKGGICPSSNTASFGLRYRCATS